eukprot:jgi/Tetstr1/466301/TSEL_010834.t1
MEADRYGPGPEIRSLRLMASLSLTPQGSRCATFGPSPKSDSNARTMTAAKEMRHWDPEAHIGDDGYVLADVKAAVVEATAGTTGEQEMRRVERSN